MKFSLRVLVLSMLVAVLFSGAALADVNEVVKKIQNYGFTAAVSGNVITVTGSVIQPKTGLELGDISGLTIEWNATLTADVATGNFQPTPDDGSRQFYCLIKMGAQGAEGVFQIVVGKIILNDSNPSASIPQGYPKSWSRMIVATNNVQITVDGGETAMNLVEGTAISGTKGISLKKVTVNGGKISAPYGSAIEAKDVLLKDVSGITGTVQNTEAKTVDMYGDFSIVCDDSATFDGEDVSGYEGWVYTVKSGAKMTVAHPNMVWAVPVTLRVEDGGIIEILKDSKLTLKCKSVEIMGTVSRNIAKGSALAVNVGTLDNAGTLVLASTANVNNKGNINNTGTITNAGNIVNEGTIANNGKITSTGTIKSDPANVTGNAVDGKVEPITPSNGGGSSGGCNTGIFAPFAAFALVPFIFKKRK